jgi:hypothetical protein
MPYGLLAAGAPLPGGLFAVLVDRGLSRSIVGLQGRPASERVDDKEHIETS